MIVGEVLDGNSTESRRGITDPHYSFFRVNNYTQRVTNNFLISNKINKNDFKPRSLKIFKRPETKQLIIELVKGLVLP